MLVGPRHPCSCPCYRSCSCPVPVPTPVSPAPAPVPSPSPSSTPAPWTSTRQQQLPAVANVTGSTMRSTTKQFRAPFASVGSPADGRYEDICYIIGTNSGSLIWLRDTTATWESPLGGSTCRKRKAPSDRFRRRNCTPAPRKLARSSRAKRARPGPIGGATPPREAGVAANNSSRPTTALGARPYAIPRFSLRMRSSLRGSATKFAYTTFENYKCLSVVHSLTGCNEHAWRDYNCLPNFYGFAAKNGHTPTV